MVAMWQLCPGRVCLVGESVTFTTAFGKQKKEGFTVRTDGLNGKTYEWHSRAHGHVIPLCDEPAGWAARQARGPDVAVAAAALTAYGLSLAGRLQQVLQLQRHHGPVLHRHWPAPVSGPDRPPRRAPPPGEGGRAARSEG